MGARPLSGSLWGFDSWSALGGWIWWALGGGCCPILQHRSRFPGRGNKQLSIGAICFLLEWNTRLLSDSKRFQKVNSAPRTKAFDWCQCLKVIASKHVLKSRSRWCDWFTWALFPNANNGRLLLPNIRYNHAVRQFVSKTCRSQVSLCCHSGDSVVNRSDPVATVDGCAYERDYIERLGLCHVQWSTWRFNRVWYVLMFHRCLLLGIAGGSEKGDKPIRPSLLQPQALGKKCSPSRVAVRFFGLLFTYRIKPPCNLWFRSLLYNTGRIPYNIVIQLYIITYNIVTYNSIINLSFKYFEGAYADPP